MIIIFLGIDECISNPCITNASVKMVLIHILASVRKDLLVMAMELPVATGNLITDNL